MLPFHDGFWVTYGMLLFMPKAVFGGLVANSHVETTRQEECATNINPLTPSSSVLLQWKSSTITLNGTLDNLTASNQSSRQATLLTAPRSWQAALLDTRWVFVVITVPMKFAPMCVVCLPLGILYLAHLWKQSGFFQRIEGGFHISEKDANAFVALTTYLVMLVSMDVVIKYEAERGHGTYATSPLVMVPLAEFGKLLVSALMYLASLWWSHSNTDPAATSAVVGSTEGKCNSALRVAVLMLPVACIYNLNNLLVFRILASIKLDAYAVWRNISILFNALLWVWTFGKRLQRHRWVAIVICLAACCLNSLQLDGRLVCGLPVLGVVLSACLSSVASIFNEYVIKARASTSLAIDQVNMILYFETISLMMFGFACWVLFDSSVTMMDIFNRFRDISSGGLRIAAMQVALGISVSRVLKFADSVSKTVVGSFRDVVVVVVAPFFVLGTRSDWLAISSVVWMALAGMIYFTTVPEPGDDSLNVKN